MLTILTLQTLNGKHEDGFDDDLVTVGSRFELQRTPASTVLCKIYQIPTKVLASSKFFFKIEKFSNQIFY